MKEKYSPAKQQLVDSYGGSISLSDFANRLGVDKSEVQRLTSHGHLLCLTDGYGSDFYPLWQIHKKSILKGLPEVLLALADKSTWAKQIFFVTYSDFLEGKLADKLGTNDIAPIMALRAGYKATVLNCIEY